MYFEKCKSFRFLCTWHWKYDVHIEIIKMIALTKYRQSKCTLYNNNNFSNSKVNLEIEITTNF